MQIGIVGMGIMGRAMAARLGEKGHTVRVWNRTRATAEAGGLPVMDTPAALAAASDVIFSVVTDPAAVASVTLGPEGILAGLTADGVHADMSTVAPDAARRMAAEYERQGRRFVQAPVLGSKRQIESGTLLVFAGGTTEDTERCEVAWASLAERVWRFPTVEQAASAKLACNLLIGHLIVGLGQSLLFGQQNGIAPETLLEILAASALGCPMFASKGTKILDRDFDANFFVRHMLKDLTLAADAGQQSRTPLPLNALTRELFVAADAQGSGTEDYSAVVKVLERLAGAELRRGG
ncbi:MAG: NAD(P)-dependent oxidoreductase [Armatimonadota bacterium]|nr:NAD(P)-dependent oxidoreductase [Armatimonadota bacterium]